MMEKLWQRMQESNRRERALGRKYPQLVVTWAGYGFLASKLGHAHPYTGREFKLVPKDLEAKLAVIHRKASLLARQRKAILRIAWATGEPFPAEKIKAIREGK